MDLQNAVEAQRYTKNVTWYQLIYSGTWFVVTVFFGLKNFHELFSWSSEHWITLVILLVGTGMQTLGHIGRLLSVGLFVVIACKLFTTLFVYESGAEAVLIALCVVIVFYVFGEAASTISKQ